MSLPREVSYWCALAELRMNDNGLQRLPETLGMMTSLEHAGFASNAIDSFPTEVTHPLQCSIVIVPVQRYC
jgi:hypothetical protein